MKLITLTRTMKVKEGETEVEKRLDHTVNPDYIMFFHEAQPPAAPATRVWFVGAAFMDVDHTVAELRDMLEGVAL